MQKTVVITGGTSKLGPHIAKTLKLQNFKVIIQYHAQQDVANALLDQGTVDSALRADFSNMQDVESLIAKIYTLVHNVDLLINNAAIFEIDIFGDVSYALLDRHLKINAIAPTMLIQGIIKRQLVAPQVINLLDKMLKRKNKRYFSYKLSKQILEVSSGMIEDVLEGVDIKNLYLESIDSSAGLASFLLDLERLVVI